MIPFAMAFGSHEVKDKFDKDLNLFNLMTDKSSAYYPKLSVLAQNINNRDVQG